MSHFGSFAMRIYSVAALTIAMALLLGFLMLQSRSRSQDAFESVSHTQDVIISLDAVETGLSKAESGLRGYLMTRDRSYLVAFNDDLREAQGRAAKLTTLVLDNPAQVARASRLANLAARKAMVMQRAVQRTFANPTVSLPDAVERMRGRSLMTTVTQQVGDMRREERRLLALRTAGVQTKVHQAKALLLYGFPLLVLLIGGLAWLIRISISRPLADLLDVVTDFGAGDRNSRAATERGSVEFRRLAVAYNEMADGLVLATDKQDMRQQSVQVLSDMSQRLQAIQNESELSEAFNCFLPQVLPDLAGALYVHNHSRNMLHRVANWGNPQSSPEMISPADCWGLRRGQAHRVEKPGADLMCAHSGNAVTVERWCEPVLAGGEVLGLLYVEGSVSAEARFRMNMLMENIALALVNDNLRSRLREQSIRDPLTKLFNRRYMEEALAWRLRAPNEAARRCP